MTFLCCYYYSTTTTTTLTTKSTDGTAVDDRHAEFQVAVTIPDNLYSQR